MKITTLGTGHGAATKCYNTCFTMDDGDDFFLVDAGGGNGILSQLNNANVSLDKITALFVSHAHMDHILGAIWIIRIIGKKYMSETKEEPLYVYGNDEVVNAIIKLCNILLPKDFLNLLKHNIKVLEIKDGQQLTILNQKVTFFDINAKKVKQFGFYMNVNNHYKFTFIGDEVCSKETEKYVKNSKWLFADAYMHGKEAELYDPIKRHHHSSVRYIASVCERLNVENVILSHTMDNNLKTRKKNFTYDAKIYFSGNVFVPNDLEKIEI